MEGLLSFLMFAGVFYLVMHMHAEYCGHGSRGSGYEGPAVPVSRIGSQF